MKTFLITCLLFAHAFCLSASPPELVAIGHCLEEQLTASTWAGRTGDHWTFTNDGTLLIFDQTAQTLQSGNWNLSYDQGLTLEVIAGATVHHYRLTPHCDQESIILHEAASGEVVLVPVTKNADQLATLAGDWQKGFSSNEPFIAFKADGTYVTTDIDTDQYQLHTGRWSIVGNTLLLHKPSGKLEAYLIKHLQMDELVLSPFNTKKEDWYLNKL